MKDLNEISFKERNAIFSRLEEIASRANLSKEERAQYEYEWKINNDFYNCLDYAKEEGIKIGHEKGVEEGREQGLAEGERRTKLVVAKSLKAMALSPEYIMKATGLSVEEIEKL